ncbi:CoA transferase [Arthrobacter sp. CJ23]|nr:CoA transferase [Arthrobacter sp. CJ23]
MDTVPDLTQSLRILESVRAQSPAPCTGPRRWWRGELDVEGLALGAVRAAATALNALTNNAGRYSVEAGSTAASFDSLGHLRIAGLKAEAFAPMSGFRRTSDGWIRLHANYPHHEARLLEALRATGPTEVDTALLGMTAVEAEDAICARGGVAAAVRTREEWLATPMHAAAAAGPWVRFSGPGTAPHAPSAGRPSSWLPSAFPDRPLAGLRVLDLTRVIAGPIATRLLGALGADVLRIDPPDLPELPDLHVDTGFDKRSAVADFRDPGVLRALEQLLDSADVVVSGYRAGGLDRFGLGPEALLARRPDLVVVALSAWGHEGPWRGRRGFDSLVQAASGIAARYGRLEEDGWHPGTLPVQALDHATGYGLAAAALSLLAERLRTGTGGWARLSLARTAEELFALPAAADPADEAPQPRYRIADSVHGRLRHVPPPLCVDGAPLGYSGPPVRYGSSRLRWL